MDLGIRGALAAPSSVWRQISRNYGCDSVKHRGRPDCGSAVSALPGRSAAVGES